MVVLRGLQVTDQQSAEFVSQHFVLKECGTGGVETRELWSQVNSIRSDGGVGHGVSRGT